MPAIIEIISDYNSIEYSRIELDGKPLDNLDQYRVRTEPFEVEYPEHDALFGVHGGISKAIADGVYILWQPHIGKHEIHYEGKINLADKKDSIDHTDHVENVTYRFTVE